VIETAVPVHETSEAVGKLGRMMEQVLTVMKTLAEVVKGHERRISGLEGIA
jgi:hypothetical protein